ncbi:MAG: LptF/LptG family permease [Spirochaetales bacterium]|uniref:LptF/LptG family permease n=1 Tax=Candidatus Thalassospirochaeta sargassi TaxID=3119039 RepID=A0AAJ1MN06_9SPIO|nr:LptF/LptG family permease [Spirochaetales bacterium]
MIKTLDRMIIKQFLPTLLVSMLFFILILEMVELFSNLWRYINNGVTITEMMQVFLYYLPSCINFSLPMSLLFSVSFTLGNYYANNELIAIFGSGVPLFRFVIALVFFGLLFSFASFIFEERVVIDSFKLKNELTNKLLRQSTSLNNNNPTVIDNNGTIIYSADFYNDKDITLSNIIVIHKDENGSMLKTINAEWAEWNTDEQLWEFHRCRRYHHDPESGFFVSEYDDIFTDPVFKTDPFTFRRVIRDVGEMKIRDAKLWIESLRKAGLPYAESLTAYYRRFSFSLTPFVVCLLSAAIGGRFRKNILLMSLLTSLVISVVYYVLQLVFTILANLGYISPAAGAWIPFIFFCVIGFFLYRFAQS